MRSPVGTSSNECLSLGLGSDGENREALGCDRPSNEIKKWH